MDELYDNLENYHEENTIAELRDENKDLKFKLEEYASALEKLQKEFDTLAIEHKKLEFNYSSLLKTARSEIERKTQIITKLNIEKDAMVLNSIQNRNLPYHRRWNKQINIQETKPTKQPVNSNEKKKLSTVNQVSNERTSDNSRIDNLNTVGNNHLPYPAPHSTLQTRLLDMVNKSVGDTSVKSKHEVKENIQLNDAPRSCARIGNRRKSMPAFSMDNPRFSPVEDEIAGTGSGRKMLPREPDTTYTSLIPSKPNTEKSFSHEPSRDLRTKLNKYDYDKPKSQERYDTHKYRRNYSPDRRNHPERRGSPDRRRGSPDNRKITAERRRGSPDRRIVIPDRRRVSPHRKRVTPDRRKPSPDRRRVSPDRRRVSPNKRRISPEKRRASPDRRRQSPNRRRGSPDRHIKGSRDHNEELHLRQEYDRHRRLVSPTKEKNYDQKHQSREVQKPHEVYHPQGFEKYKSHSQDKYPMKHKMSNDYEEPSKRMRLDSHHKIEEGSIAEPDFSYLHQDMSCQSPEFNSLEAQSSHQIREIKLYATTELEDPRKSSNRYFLKTHSGKPVLSSVKNDNIDLKIIDTSRWDIIQMKMPDALLQKPDPSVLACDLFQKTVPPVLPPQLAKSNCAIPSDNVFGIESCPNNSLSKDQAFESGALSERAITPTFIHKKKSPKIQEESVEKASDMPDVLIQKQSSSSSTQLHIDMPDTASQKPISTVDIVNEIYMDIDNPISNLSVESGEIYDELDVISYEQTENTAPEVESKNVETKCRKDYQAVEHGKDAVLSHKHKENKPSPKIKHKRLTNKQADETNIYTSEQEDKSPFQRMTSQPFSNDVQNELQSYASSKEIIGDFEMSDDGTSDNTDIQTQKQTNTVLHTDHESVIGPSIDIKATSNEHESGITGKSKMSPLDSKTKSKKKSHKPKDNQILPAIESSIPLKEKYVKIIETTSKEQFEDSTLSMDELVKIRENLIKGLENKETPMSNEKSVKKKDYKTKTSPEIKELDSPTDKKGTLVSNEKTVKKKETKALPENKEQDPYTDSKETLVSNEKSVKRKETKTSHENKERDPSTDSKETQVSNEKSAKKKETKAKTPQENTELDPPINKSIKKKENKTKEQKSKATTAQNELAEESYKSKETNKVSPEHKNTYKQRKKKQNALESAPPVIDKSKATKFTELFGDSSSLVSPEDLGLVATVIPQENYVTMFEDAQDATDVAAIKAAVASITTENNKNKGNSGNIAVVSQGSILSNEESVSKELAQSAIPLQNSLYQNLQPEIKDNENDNIKTVIISSGVQPQFISEDIKSNSVPIDSSEDLHVMQCVQPTVLQGLGIQALATSTPHKWQQNVQLETECMPTTSKYVSHESIDNSVDKTPAIFNSDNTNSSKVNADEPDMKIFVKRRRKAAKKK